MQLEKGYPQHDTRAATHCIDLPPSQGTCHIHFHAATCAVGTLACAHTHTHTHARTHTHTHTQSHKGNQVALPGATGKSGALPRVRRTVLRCFMRFVLQHVRRNTTPICSCQQRGLFSHAQPNLTGWSPSGKWTTDFAADVRQRAA